eukprot:6174267-Pleurochrysis_carterae.AAC.3
MGAPRRGGDESAAHPPPLASRPPRSARAAPHRQRAGSEAEWRTSNHTQLRGSNGADRMCGRGGVKMLKRADAGAAAIEERYIDLELEKEVIAAFAWCPAASDLLAVAVVQPSAVRLWTIPSEAETTSVLATYSLQGTCRQLLWHPSLRVLAVLTSNSLELLVSAPRGAKRLEMPLVCLATSGALTLQWTPAGDALLVGFEDQVLSFHWTIVGAWQQYKTASVPISARRLCSLSSSGSLVFVLGLGVPIKTHEAAGCGEVLKSALREVSTSRSSTLSEPGRLDLASSSQPEAGGAASPNDLTDLRGRLGAVSREKSACGALFNIARAQAPSPACLGITQSRGASGALQLCTSRSGVLSITGQCIHTNGLGCPDLLSCTSTELGNNKGLVLVGSSFSSTVLVFHTAATEAPQLISALEMPQAHCCRGVCFDPTGCAWLLAGRRKQEYVVYSAFPAEQELLLCKAPMASLSSSVQSATDRKENNPEFSFDIDSRQAAALELQPRGDADASHTEAHRTPQLPQLSNQLLLALQSHLDERFDRIEGRFSMLECRLAKIERLLAKPS